MFILHREVSGPPNTQFLMHDSGLHYYEPPKKDLIFLDTVSKNKEGFSKTQIKSVVKYQELQHTLGYPTAKEVMCIIRSNQIQDCQIETKDVDNAKNIWGKDVPYLEGKMTRKKPIQVSEDLIRFPKEFLKLNKYVFLTKIYFL